MQIKVKVGGNTTSGEFKALAIFFNALAVNKASELIPAAEQPAQLPAAEPKVVISDEPVQGQAQGAEPAATQPQTTTRRRRTKAEIEADEAAKRPADPEPEQAVHVKPEAADASNENQADAVSEVKTESVDTATGEIKDVEEFEKAAEAAAPTGGKTYTEAEVQSLAAVIARSKGAQVVKDKIADLGKARIADLDEAQLNQLGAFLESQK